jgi:hypothetical protein
MAVMEMSQLINIITIRYGAHNKKIKEHICHLYFDHLSNGLCQFKVRDNLITILFFILYIIGRCWDYEGDGFRCIQVLYLMVPSVAK